MRARAGDFLVLLAPTVVVGVLVPVVTRDDPSAYVPMLLVLLIIATIGIAFGLILLAQTTRGPSTFAIVVWREQAAFRSSRASGGSACSTGCSAPRWC